MLDTIAQSWLTLQCQMIPNTERALVTLEPPSDDTFKTNATWPSNKGSTEELEAAGRLATEKAAAVVQPRQATNGVARPVVLAYPLISNERVYGAVVLQLSDLDESQQQAVVQLLKWGSALLEFMVRQGTGAAVAARLATVIETTVASLEHPRLQAAATAAATHMAQSLDCERVSIGFCHGRQIRLSALSRTAKLDRRSNLARDIEAAMEEAIEEKIPIAVPPSSPRQNLNYPAHERLARRYDATSICSVPLESNGKTIGALTFERARPLSSMPVPSSSATPWLVCLARCSRSNATMSALLASRSAIHLMDTWHDCSGHGISVPSSRA